MPYAAQIRLQKLFFFALAKPASPTTHDEYDFGDVEICL